MLDISLFNYNIAYYKMTIIKDSKLKLRKDFIQTIKSAFLFSSLFLEYLHLVSIVKIRLFIFTHSCMQRTFAGERKFWQH